MTALAPSVPDLPFALQLELTSTCNLRCTMCPLTTGTSSTSSSPGPIEERTWAEVLPLAARCQQVFIAGYGEPLTNPRCLDLLRDLDRAGVSFSIATNGLVLSDRIAAELAALSNLTQVNVSIDTPDPVTYRDIRGGNLDRALQGLRHLTTHLDPGRVTASVVLMQTAVASLRALPALLEDLGVHHLDLTGVMDYNDRAASERLLGRTDLLAALDALEEDCRRRGIYVAIGSEDRLRLELADPEAARRRWYADPVEVGEARQCAVPWEVPFVDKDGGVFPCCFAASQGEHRMGSLQEQSFDDIWVDAPFRRFRSDILEASTTPAVCRRCTVSSLGPHQLREWAGEVVDGSVVVTARRVRFSVRNTGARTWTRADLVRVGTASPRDGVADMAHSTWLFPHRVGTFREREVRPGDAATFSFAVAPSRDRRRQSFQLVVEGICWMPGTFVTADVRPSSPADIVAERVTSKVRDRIRRDVDRPSAGYLAEVVSVLPGPTTEVVVRNTGTHRWTSSDLVRIGTADPHDREPSTVPADWINPTRAAGFVEPSVPVGEHATFRFSLPPGPQTFQLVADGHCWLPGTRFTADLD